MEHVCSGCNQPLSRGVRVVQMLRGTMYKGHITPAWSQVLAEWHEGCFHEFPLHAQTQPYKCQSCQNPVAHGAAVFCFVVGYETTADYSISERRGYEIYSVRHVDCPIEESDRDDPARSFAQNAQDFGCGLPLRSRPQSASS